MNELMKYRGTELKLIEGTPVEVHRLPTSRRPVEVKREDMCCPRPGPTFSKIRGVYRHIERNPARTIGVLDTYHSKAGWAVSAVCAALGRECINYWPHYKADAGAGLRWQQEQSTRWGARLLALPAGRSAVLYHQAKKSLANLPNSYLMPNALKLPETVVETAEEFKRTPIPEDDWSLVVSVSSGTIFAGVLQGLFESSCRLPSRIFAHMGYSRSEDAFKEYVRKVSRVADHEWTETLLPRLELINEGYGYKDAARPGAVASFPCNPYYDLKAWRWLDREWQRVPEGRILFWNIGD